MSAADMRRAPSAILAMLLCGCSNEAREIGPTVPQTAPASERDPRIAYYQGNFGQVAQGGRYFLYYGCAGCHGDGAPGARDLTDGRWKRGGGFAAVFTSIAHGHGDRAYATRIPVEPLWQLTAYVRDLERHTPEKRRRQALDQQAEPQGAAWWGPQ